MISFFLFLKWYHSVPGLGRLRRPRQQDAQVGPRRTTLTAAPANRQGGRGGATRAGRVGARVFLIPHVVSRGSRETLHAILVAQREHDRGRLPFTTGKNFHKIITGCCIANDFYTLADKSLAAYGHG